jgi:hypothetical protein
MEVISSVQTIVDDEARWVIVITEMGIVYQ